MSILNLLKIVGGTTPICLELAQILYDQSSLKLFQFFQVKLRRQLIFLNEHYKKCQD